MNTLNFSQLGHTYLSYANPFSEAAIDSAIAICKRHKPSKALDIGAGNCYLLKKFVKEIGCSGTAVELPGIFNVEDLKLPSEISFVAKNASEFVSIQENNCFDLAICIGASHALGGYEKTLSSLSRVLRTGGLLVMGEGYWLKKPDKEYLEILGAQEDELRSHCENLLIAEKMSLLPVWSRTASTEEWDHYEWNYSTGIEDFFLKHPFHPQRQEFLDRISKWRHGYWKWGRGTLGFGFYVLRKF